MIFFEEGTLFHTYFYTIECVNFEEEVSMAANLAIDDALLQRALTIGGLKTKKETVNTALEEFIQRRKVKDVISMFGNVEANKGYDYKKLRYRK